MWQNFLNWRFLVLLAAMVIVAATVVYTGYLGKKIESEETQRVKEWVFASRVLQTSDESNALTLANQVIFHNEDIPLIATDEAGNIVDFRNIDSAKAANDANYLTERLTELRQANNPIDWPISESPAITYKVYYGNTALLN